MTAPLMLPAAALLAADVEAGRAFVESDPRAARTLKEYAKRWGIFSTWCSERGLASLPAEAGTVALFATWRARSGRKPATIAVDLAAVAHEHQEHGHANPCGAPVVARAMANVKREVGVAQRQKRAITRDELRAAVRALPAGPLGLRDRALLLVGFVTASRRSELVGFDVEDLATTPRGLEVTLRRSKTDQQGQGRVKALPRSLACTGDDTCADPVCVIHALTRWTAAAGIAEGAIFRSVDRHGRVGARLSPAAVAEVVKRALARVGVDPAAFAGHSLRAGLVVAAIEDGRSAVEVREVTGHKSDAMLSRYYRQRDAARAVSGIL